MSDGFELVMYGADESVWYLTGPAGQASPARMMEGEVSQLYITPGETTYRPRVGEGGATYRGHRDLPALVPLRVDFIGTDWARNLSRFRRALRPDADAVLEMRTPETGARRLTIRAHEAPVVLNEHDPGPGEAVIVEFPVIAPRPYWESVAPLTAEWQASTRVIHGELVVSNPGEVPVWPRYICTAPAGWILPDVDHEQLTDSAPRVVELPWLPSGRDVLVDTDPLQLTVEAVDETLAPLAGLRGAQFMHPIPPGAHEVRLPVSIDPIPGLQLAIPDEWRHWIAVKLQELAETIGAGEWSAMTPEVVGQHVEDLINGSRPEWLPDLSEGLVAKLTANAIADAWRDHYGRWGVVDGSTVQVQIWPRWRSPW